MICSITTVSSYVLEAEDRTVNTATGAKVYCTGRHCTATNHILSTLFV